MSKKHKCDDCGHLVGESYIIFYDSNTNWIHYFCSWFHMTRWKLKKIFKKGGDK